MRASRSATANIAEGWGRYHFKENVRFLLIARGSVAEILDHSLEARSWNYITEEILLEISQHEKTTIIYESPKRLKKLLKELLKFCGGD